MPKEEKRPWIARAINWLYLLLAVIVCGKDAKKIIGRGSYCTSDDLIRPHVYSMRGMMDSIAAAIVCYGLVLISGLLGKIIQTPHHENLHPALILIAYGTILVLIIDDYTRARYFNFKAPCRSVGRFAANLLVLIAFALGLLIFTVHGIKAPYGWLAFSLAFATRFIWSIKVYVEAFVWERYIHNLTKTAIQDGYGVSPWQLATSRGELTPRMFDPEIWHLYRIRVKSTGLFSWLYFVLSGFLFIYFYLKLNILALFSRLVATVGLGDYIPSSNAKFIMVYLIIITYFFICEKIRFQRDFERLLNVGFSRKEVASENFSSVMKSVFFMPPWLKRLFTKRITPKEEDK